jgi:hypothetical protein
MTNTISKTTIQVQIETPHWLNHKTIYFSREFISFFPADALKARDKSEQANYPKNGIPVTFDYGVSKSICDISIKAGRMRPSITGKPIDDFYKAFNAEVGDYVTVSKGPDRVFHIKLVKVNGSTV